jgi:hypothetical protein
MTPEQKQLIEDWRDDCKLLLSIHFDKSSLCEKLNLWLAIPAVIFSTVVGTSVFTSLGKDPTLWIQIMVAAVSLLVSLLAGLQAYFKVPERAEKHRLTGAMYAALKKEIEHVLVMPPKDQESLGAWMSEVRVKWEHLRRESIALPKSQLQSYRKDLSHKAFKDKANG